MKKSALTFDVDWAPDWCVEMCMELCRQYQFPATYFITHPSNLIDELGSDPLFEVGIHPNFLSSSTHGSKFDEVMEYCLRLAPNARAMRTHSLVQSSVLYAEICDSYPNIEIDVSLLLPLHPGLQPTELHLGESKRRLIRIPYFWEDDIVALDPNWEWNLPAPPSTGLRVFDFHPTFIALNIDTLDGYDALKGELSGRPLFEATRSQFSRHENFGLGARTFFEALLADESKEEFCTISKLGQLYKMKLEDK